MNRYTILRPAIAVALFSMFLLSFSSGLMAQEVSEKDKKATQKMYTTYLEKEGYKPEIDEDGDVRFKREGKTYFINVDPADPMCFRLVLANIWPIESEEERVKVRVAMDHCNAQAKVAKAYMVRDNVWVAIETFIPEPEDFEAIFKRSLSALDYGVMLYAKKMREE